LETNPYAPPSAAVADIAPAKAVAIPRFFPVSRRKLVVMSTATLTLYQFVWFYLNWRLVNRNGNNVAPLVRTFFTVIFCYALFDRVRWYRKDLPSSALPAGLLALGWIVVSIASDVLDRVVERAGLALWIFLVALVLSYASVLFLLPVQDAIDAINRAEVPDHDPNDRFTVWNWLWIVGGGFLTLTVVAGALLPME
jgi:hypothetical protein